MEDRYLFMPAPWRMLGHTRLPGHIVIWALSPKTLAIGGEALEYGFGIFLGCFVIAIANQRKFDEMEPRP